MSRFTSPPTAPLTIRRSDDGAYTVTLAGADITHLIAGEDGLNIEFVSLGSGWPIPQVTIAFALDALDIDLDDALVRYITEKASAKATAGGPA